MIGKILAGQVLSKGNSGVVNGKEGGPRCFQ